MKRESKIIQMRAYRITESRGRKYSNWIVLEDVERKVFMVSSSYGSSSGVPRHDPSDTRDALIALREEWRRNFSPVPIDTLLPLEPANSIDRAIVQAEIRITKLWELARKLKTGRSVPEDIRKASHPSDPPIIVTHSEPRSDQELERKLQRFEKVLTDYQGGKQLRWKSKGRTPAGRTRAVLTLDGSEEMLVGEKSVELPSK